MHLGLVTYNLAADWDLGTLLQRCAATGFEGVELRTTHAHGVEETLSTEQRREVRQRFADSPVQLFGLGSIYEFHSLDPAVVRQNVEGTKRCLQLAHDLGASGVKVRPNGHQEKAGVPREQTLEQIGRAARECGQTAQELGVELRMEMHGAVRQAGTMRRIFEVAGDACWACWNSNEDDVQDGSIKQAFDQVSHWIREAHITRLWNPAYPYREFFSLLKGVNAECFCLAEIPASADPEELMHYYRALFDCLVA
ncbi:MAG: sugar phosphate isomerase/epimerase family protein [Chloroflexota bacterium]